MSRTPAALLILKVGSAEPLVRARFGDFEDWFRRDLALPEGAVDVLDARHEAELPDPGTLSGLIVTGSSSMVTDQQPWSRRAGAWLGEAARNGLPMLAVCYGHQLLAQSLGGSVGWNPNGREIGTTAVELSPGATGDSLLRGLPRRLVVQATHSQSVLALPPGARLLAGNAHDPHQAFVCKGTAWAVQFHPEFRAEVMRGYVQARARALEAEGRDGEALQATVRDSDHGARLLRNFRRLCGWR